MCLIYLFTYLNIIISVVVRRGGSMVVTLNLFHIQNPARTFHQFDVITWGRGIWIPSLDSGESTFQRGPFTIEVPGGGEWMGVKCIFSLAVGQCSGVMQQQKMYLLFISDTNRKFTHSAFYFIDFFSYTPECTTEVALKYSMTY